MDTGEGKGMNRYLQGQINNMIAMAGTFLQGCEMAAKQDDGTISREEQKQLAAIDAATKKFIRSLEKIK